jgi:hypothetical protein
MDAELLKTLGLVAGIGGIALGVFLLIFRDVVRRQIFGRLNKDQTYRLFRLILILTWSIAVLGMGAWVYANWVAGRGNTHSPTPTPLEAKVTLDAHTYDAEDLILRLTELTGNIMLDLRLGAKLKGRKVKFPSALDEVSLKTVLDSIFTEVGIRVDYVNEGGTIVIREKGAS